MSGRRFIYGDSYGDIGNRELATDAARDSRYFNALASNRSDQQLADSEVNAADESNLRWTGLADQAAARDASARQFDQTLGVHTGQLDLEKAKFAHTVAQPTAAELRDKERRFEIEEARKATDFNDAQTFHLSGDIAKAGNELNDVNSQITDLQHKKALLDHSLTGPNMPRWMFGGGTESTLRGEFANTHLNPDLSGPVDQAEFDVHFQNALKLLTDRKERLQSYINNATAKGANVDLYNLDEHGNYQPTFKPRNPANPFITRHVPAAIPPLAPELQGRSFSAAIGGDASPGIPAWLQSPGMPTGPASFVVPPAPVFAPKEGDTVLQKSTGRLFSFVNGQLVPQ